MTAIVVIIGTSVGLIWAQSDVVVLCRMLMCRLNRCGRCRWLDTDRGLGVKCVDCGRVHGWMSNEELRQIRG